MHASSQPPNDQVPLYVDLDGTLTPTDTLWESLMTAVHSRPGQLPAIVASLARGKACFKTAIADRVLPDVETLPIRPEVLELIQARKAAGARIVLATAADHRIAEAVAARLGVFDAVLASDAQTNLAGSAKLEAIRRQAGDGAFDYVGDSKADLPIFAACRSAYVVGSSESVLSKASAGRPPGSVVSMPGSKIGAKGLLKAIRVHQWAKNVLVGVPIVVSHQISELQAIQNTVLAFFAFSFVASSIYIINDLLDLPSDRAHPRKRNRPFASGVVPIPIGLLLTTVLLAAGLTVSFAALGLKFGGVMLLYAAITTIYSTVLKRKLMMDVLTLAGLYTLRIFAGATAIDVLPSEWLLAFSMFIFTTLAMVKRYAELRVWSDLNVKSVAGRVYNVEDMELFRSLGPGAAYAAVMVFALYISSDAVAPLYRRPLVLWMVCPVLLYWLTRLWFLTNQAHGRKKLEDPVVFALTDKASIVCGAVVMLLVFLAT